MEVVVCQKNYRPEVVLIEFGRDSVVQGRIGAIPAGVLDVPRAPQPVRRVRPERVCVCIFAFSKGVRDTPSR